MTQDKVNKEDDKDPVANESEQEDAQLEDDASSEVEQAVSDLNDDCQDEEVSANPESEQEPEQVEHQYSGLEEMRQKYEGVSKDQINQPDEGNKEADDKTLESAADMEAENVGDLASNVSTLLGDESTASFIGEVIKGSYLALKTVVQKIKESKEDDEEASANKKSMWQKFKDFISQHKDKLMTLGEMIISKIPILRSILSAYKMVSNIVKFFVINGTRKRMATQRRKFKEKYENKEEDGQKFVEKSTGFMSWAKRKLGVKKTDQTVNKELVEKKYKGASGTRATLDKSETKDMRQYLIDDKLMKLNKQRQIKKGKDAAFDGLSTAVNVMNDVAAFASMGASEAGSTVVGFVFNDASSSTADIMDAGKGIAEKALGLAEMKVSHDDMKEAVEYTGILLEHVGGMTPYKPEVNEEFEHVESDLEATGVDKKELYKNNGKKKEQKKLLIEALAE